MANQIADKRDIDFVLYEQFDVESLTKTKKFEGQNKKMYEMVVKEARKFAIKEILPLNEEGDKIGLTFKDNRVYGPEGFLKCHKLLIDGEYVAMDIDPEHGGMGFPHVITHVVKEYLLGADFAFSSMIVGCHGAGKMIELYGTERQQRLYMDKLYAGKWAGTMVLTESEAGSDVGGLSTEAVQNDDGTWSITGNKIFITGGEHEMTENIVHPVLARIKGGPKGSKGISIFLVPKYLVNEDGSLGEKNDVLCTGIEEKMGLHASPTCQMSFGSKGKCIGELLGEENKGMRVMFSMMNEARLDVAALGLYNASCAYLYAVNYAKERVQGRDLSDMLEHSAPSVAIIKHPDVRRMLLWMKSHMEGMRSAVYYISLLLDKANCSDEDERSSYIDMVELLTPVLKSYCTDRGFECTVQAMQVYGGYGYTKDYPIERLMRDSKINSIYEGTNGIQGLDLLGRKLGMKNGVVFMNLLSDIQKTIADAKENNLDNMAFILEKAVNRLGETAMNLGKKAMSPEYKVAFSFASPFLDVVGDTVMAWMLLWRAVTAKPALEKITKGLDGDLLKEKIEKNKNAAFYQGQINSAKYFIESIIPVTMGKMDAVQASSDVIMDTPEVSFGG
ncbi:MAG: acyl-CoA dehydrogenase [Desulfobacterales bacterium]|nr:acyl-CoA dehydrogenase [Desulfobacterales bacterium]MCP4159203.1 acyl-CoA dehydrogenase [Deltaproteobacteria bacterium]